MNIETTGKSSDSYYNGRYWYCSFSGIPSYSDNPKSGSGEVGHSEGQAMSSNVSNQRRNMGWGIGYVGMNAGSSNVDHVTSPWTSDIIMPVKSRQDGMNINSLLPAVANGFYHILHHPKLGFFRTHIETYWNNIETTNHEYTTVVIFRWFWQKNTTRDAILLDKPWKHTNNWPCLKP